MKVEYKLIAYGTPIWEEAVKLREKILRAPLGSKFTSAELAEEKNHLQITGQQNGQVVATAVLVPEGNTVKMQRVVVLEKLQNQQIGTNLMDFCENYARKNGFKIIYCHARDSAVNFYLKNGYTGEGDYFDEDGIPHLKMIKNLATEV